ncbi:MAG: hypothetical protein U5L09_13705 [Bacteroidales bacterium]|nr:hypothetical protein [Bacteroidales bacterium]
MSSEDLFSLGHRKPIEKRLEKKYLDSLIRHELDLKGLETDYQFAVYSTGRDRLVMRSDVENEDLLKGGRAWTFQSFYPSEIFTESRLPNARYIFLTSGNFSLRRCRGCCRYRCCCWC